MEDAIKVSPAPKVSISSVGGKAGEEKISPEAVTAQAPSSPQGTITVWQLGKNIREKKLVINIKGFPFIYFFLI